MSLTIQELHQDFKMKSSKLDSSSVKNLIPMQIDWVLNDAYSIYLERRYGVGDPKNLSFEETQKRIDDLAPLVVKYPNQPALTPSLIADDMYEINLSDLEETYLHTLRLSGTATSGNCTTEGMKCVFVQHDDLNDSLENPYYKSSFLWRTVLYNYGAGSSGVQSLYFYTAGFTLDEIRIDYLKQPAQLWFGDYDYYDTLYNTTGNLIYEAGVNNPVSCELSNKQCHEIVDVAVTEFYRYLQNPQFTDLFQKRQLINE